MLIAQLTSDMDGRNAKQPVVAVQQADVFFEIALRPVEKQDGRG